MFWKRKRQQKPLDPLGEACLEETRRAENLRRDEAEIEALREEQYLIENGLLEPGQPTLPAHARHVARMEEEFTPRERRMIRYLLGITTKDTE